MFGGVENVQGDINFLAGAGDTLNQEAIIDDQLEASRELECRLTLENERLAERDRVQRAIRDRIRELTQQQAEYNSRIHEVDTEIRTLAIQAAQRDRPRASVPPSFAGVSVATPASTIRRGISEEPEYLEDDVVRDPDVIRLEPAWDFMKRHLDRGKNWKPNSSPKYKGETKSECDKCLDHWEGVFRAQPWTYSRHSGHINIAASYLIDTAQSSWTATIKSGNPPTTWNGYKLWCSNIILIPVRRDQEAFEEHRNLKQKEGESVRTLYNRMIQLEQDLDEVPSNKRRIQTFQAAIQDAKTMRNLLTMLGKDADFNVTRLEDHMEAAQTAEQAAYPNGRKQVLIGPRHPEKRAGSPDTRERRDPSKYGRGGGNSGRGNRRSNTPGVSRLELEHLGRSVSGTTLIRYLLCM